MSRYTICIIASRKPGVTDITNLLFSIGIKGHRHHTMAYMIGLIICSDIRLNLLIARTCSQHGMVVSRQ